MRGGQTFSEMDLGRWEAGEVEGFGGHVFGRVLGGRRETGLRRVRRRCAPRRDKSGRYCITGFGEMGGRQASGVVARVGVGVGGVGGGGLYWRGDPIKALCISVNYPSLGKCDMMFVAVKDNLEAL